MQPAKFIAMLAEYNLPKMLSANFMIKYWIIPAMFGFFLGWNSLAADLTITNSPAPFDFATPKVLTGKLYEIGSHRQKLLFNFRRTAERSGSTVRVERKFFCPDGSLAAAENVVYESGQFASLQMKEFQANVSGAIEVVPDSKKTGQSKLIVSYDHGLNPPKGDPQIFYPDTVQDDNLYTFMMNHWDELMRGDSVKFKFVALEWKRTFGFRLVKICECVQDGTPLVQIKMEPSNIFVAQLVNPLIFTVEKAEPHRIISYIGRTTPRIKRGKNWKYLDAETVFDWK